RTVSTIDLHSAGHPTAAAADGGSEFDNDRVSLGDYVVPRQLQSQSRLSAQRPSAPTPRRSRPYPWTTAEEDSVPPPQHRSGSGSSRVHAYLSRYASDANASASMPPQSAPAPGAGAAVPSPLAEKLVELAAMLAKTRVQPSTPTARAPTDPGGRTQDARQNEVLRAELLQLQRQILDRFDEYRAEVDMLRAEVRHASAAPSTAAVHRVPSSGIGVAPNDSVSVAAALNGVEPVWERDPMRSAPFAGADDALFGSDPAVPRMQPQLPPTARNRQRHMVKWLSSQAASPPDRRIPSPPAGSRSTDSAVPPEPSRVCEYGGSESGSEPESESVSDALSDASTTVPAEPFSLPLPRMRSPIPPHIARAVDPKRSDQKQQHPDLLEMRELLHSVRRSSIRRTRRAAGSSSPSAAAAAAPVVADAGEADESSQLYSKQLAQQLADTLGELQRVHVRHFHGAKTAGGTDRKKHRGKCAVCAALDAQNHDPYLYGRNAVAYRSMTTRQLQGLLNAYVAAMEDEFGSGAGAAVFGMTKGARRGWLDDGDDDLGHLDQPVVRLDQSKPVRHVFTPSKGAAALKGNARRGGGRAVKSSPVHSYTSDAQRSSDSSGTTRVVIGLLREELDALSRRYHRLVDEYHSLDPSNAAHQRRRRTMTRELKDLVDMLDVKGEQIAMLSALHPDAEPSSGGSRSHAYPPKDLDPSNGDRANGARAARLSAERAYKSARALQQALGELY
ncbi:hypothetical protein H4217_009040, partial [Coemansia sp. RSA 1939]